MICSKAQVKQTISKLTFLGRKVNNSSVLASFGCSCCRFRLQQGLLEDLENAIHKNELKILSDLRRKIFKIAAVSFR